MNLTWDLPFWAIRNGLMHVYLPLEENPRCDAVVIGGGISTALLQYEIDTPLYQLRTQVGSAAAARAYWLGIEAIHRLQKLAGDDCGFRFRPSLQVAPRTSDVAACGKSTRHATLLSFQFTC
jgi:hypothetical protein